MQHRTLTACAVSLGLGLALTACGGSGGASSSDKSRAGVVATIDEVTQLAHDKQGKTVCDRYMTADIKALIGAFGDCADMFDANAAAALVQDGKLDANSIRINGNTATFMWGKDKTTARYDGGQWKLALDD